MSTSQAQLRLTSRGVFCPPDHETFESSKDLQKPVLPTLGMPWSSETAQRTPAHLTASNTSPRRDGTYLQWRCARISIVGRVIILNRACILTLTIASWAVVAIKEAGDFVPDPNASCFSLWISQSLENSRPLQLHRCLVSLEGSEKIKCKKSPTGILAIHRLETKRGVIRKCNSTTWVTASSTCLRRNDKVSYS